jgi:hypothetical protein
VKWSLDLAIAVALTVVVWTVLYQTFPSEPLSAMETVFVLAVLYGLTKLGRLAWKRWGPAVKGKLK